MIRKMNLIEELLARTLFNEHIENEQSKSQQDENNDSDQYRHDKSYNSVSEESKHHNAIYEESKSYERNSSDQFDKVQKADTNTQQQTSPINYN